MTEQDQRDVLKDMLKVLERIEVKLQAHEERVQHVEDLIQRDSLRNSDVTPGASNGTSSATWQNLVNASKSSGGSRDFATQSAFYTEKAVNFDVEAYSQYSKLAPRVRYGSWRSSRSSEDTSDLLDENQQALLGKYLGDCSSIPDDGRLPLNFGWTINSTNPGVLQLVDNLAESRRLEALRVFDLDLKAQMGNDFLVVDFDPSNNSRLYRVGNEAIGGELLVHSDLVSEAPWSRLILYQGVTTGESIKREFDTGFADPIPYFKRGDTSTGLWNHLFSHLQLKRRSITSNPYTTGQLGFHTTFYDIRETDDKTRALKAKEIWKHGPLYDHPLGWHFRRCAYTLYCPYSSDALEVPSHEFNMANPHWTMLVLAPSGFYDEHNTSFPMKRLPPGRSQALGHCLGRLTRAGAELNLIGHGLARISERWAEFQSFFDYILDSGDSLMQPNEHDNLLFDDEAFSRSRRYLWAIDCLSEFESAISDNINQWDLYKSALPPLQNELDNLQLKIVERNCRLLHNQREYFRQKLASTRALRDALFSASAVIESRASTRLGENVKLLTFVSVFFIPLSFCTSLWSINDKFSVNSFIIVIIIVAFSTYTTMFNINTLAHAISRLYDRKKRRIIRAMKIDSSEIWKKRGKRFEAFRPKHEEPKPSEWYVLFYAIFNFAAVMGWKKRRREREGEGEEREVRWWGIASALRRRRREEEKVSGVDEAWGY